MFGVGLRFHARELLDVWRVAVPGALVQSMIATLLGAGVGRLVGWDWTTGLVFGGAISVASTVVLVRVLADAHALTTRILEHLGATAEQVDRERRRIEETFRAG